MRAFELLALLVVVPRCVASHTSEMVAYGAGDLVIAGSRGFNPFEGGGASYVGAVAHVW